MSFDHDSSNQAQEAIFSGKIKKSNHPVLIFYKKQVNETLLRKQFGMFFDNKLNFGEHFKFITNIVNKSMGLLRKFQMILPRGLLRHSGVSIVNFEQISHIVLVFPSLTLNK